MSRYSLLALLWIIFCFLHSLLLAAPVTEFFKNRLGPHFRFYRLFYNLFSVITLLPPFILYASLRSRTITAWGPLLSGLQAILFLAGIALLLAGARHYSASQFFGIAQLRHRTSGKSLSGTGMLDTSGILGIIRHPWYAAALLILWSIRPDPAGVITAGLLSVYTVVGTILEERRLKAEFGAPYREYCTRTSMYFPVKWALRRAGALISR